MQHLKIMSSENIDSFSTQKYKRISLLYINVMFVQVTVFVVNTQSNH
jgi:hypothetical protein